MTESTDNPSLFTEEELPKKAPRRKTAAAAPRKTRATSAPVKAVPAAASKKAARKPAAKVAPKVEPAEIPAPTPAPKPVAVAKTPATAASKPKRKSAAKEPSKEKVPEPKAAKSPRARAPKTAKVAAPVATPIAAPVQTDFTEEWQPGSGKTSVPAKAPAPVVPKRAVPAVPVAQPPPLESAPAAPVTQESHVAPEPNVIAQVVPTREMTREERIAAARQQLNVSSNQPAQEAPRHRQPFADRPPRHPFTERPRREPFGDERQPLAEQPPRQPLPEQPRPEPVFAEGIVEVSGKGFGFLRDPKRNFVQHPSDIFVTPEVCRRYSLRDGMWIRGEIRRGNRGPQLHKLTAIEGEDPEKYRAIPMFEELTTINPNHRIKLETDPDRFTTRVIDMMAPIGRGQRGLIVAPPRTGKTTLLQHIAEAVIKNHPDMKLIILLVDERPEEVTEIRRTVPAAEIMASSNDMEIKSHTRIAQLAIERAKRLAEMGKHVFVLLDSITRVGRAFNNAMAGGGRTMSGGVDARALEIPRKLFAAARNTEEAGSLTIVATALIETGSRMDDLIFQEFKGTGNMELVLDRKISDLRVYPAVDIFQSGTRREELLLTEAELYKINLIRRGLSGHKPVEAIERLLSFLAKFPTNAQMLREIPG